jgi:hypothetical protein
MLICTHSPEITSIAFDRPDTMLWHLESRDSISPVYARNKRAVFTALHRLGVSTLMRFFFAEVFLWKATTTLAFLTWAFTISSME